MNYLLLKKKIVAITSVVHPDPDWIWIQWFPGSGTGFTIRSGFREGKNNPQIRKKLNKFHFLKCWMFSFEGWRLLM
jgi:hypothetical protein